MKRLLLLLCGFPALVYAQNPADIGIAALDSLVKHYGQEGDYEKMLQYAEEAYEKSKKSQHDSLVAQRAITLGQAHKNMGNYDNALALMDNAIKIYTQLVGKQHSNYAHAISESAIVHYLLGNFDECGQRLRAALSIYKTTEGENSILYANTLEYMGLFHKQMGEYEVAEAFYQQALQIQEQKLGSEHPDYAIGLNNLATLYQAMGQNNNAEPLLKQTLAIFKKAFGAQHPNCAIILNNLGIVYTNTKQHHLAEPLFKEAAEIDRAVVGEWHIDYAADLNNLFVLYRNMGKAQQAKPLLLQAIAITKKAFSDQHPEYAQRLHNLGTLYHDAKEYAAGEKTFKQAIAILEKNYSIAHPRVIATQNALTSMYLDMGKILEARNTCLQALQLNGKIDSLPQEINETWSKKIIDAPFKDYEQTLRSLDNLYKIYNHPLLHTRIENIYHICNSALVLGEKLRNSFDSDTDKLRLLAGMQLWAERIIAFSAQYPKTVSADAAFVFAEQNKSVMLTDALKGNKARIKGDLPDSLAHKEETLQAQQSVLRKQLLSEKNQKIQDSLQNQLNLLTKDINKFKKEIEKGYPKYYQLKYASITSNAAQIRQSLDAETLFLEYFISDQKVYLFCIDKDSSSLHALTLSVDSLMQHIAVLREALTDYNAIKNDAAKNYTHYSQSAFWLYKHLLKEGIEGKTNIKKLIIVTDSELGHLPFETFLVEPAQEFTGYADLHYLLRDYSLSYNYSATLWKENLSQAKPNNNGQLYACAAHYPTNNKFVSNRTPHLIKLRSVLMDLPAAKSEIEALAANFGGEFRTELQANETHFKTHAASYGIIHLAMHGLLNQRAPMLSSLAFSEDGDSLQDNFLEAWEVAQLKLNADLVVLSACETGYGKFEQGEGVLSLARSFMYAGIPALVVSLWEVNDASTATVMKQFYQNLANGQDKAEALRQAKLSYVSNAKGTSAHPAFWSPFIQLGDSRPINVQTLGSSSSWLWWLVGAGGLIVIFAAGGRLLVTKK